MKASAHWLRDAEQERTFVWTHFPRSAPRRRTGIQLIAPVGPEYLQSHRAVRFLAGELARKGFVVVRHDHHGMANSSGDLLDPDTYAHWEQGCLAAQRHLLSVPGIEDVAVVTLRSGALISQRLLAEHPSAAVVHWFPYLKGTAFVRDLDVIDAMLGLPVPTGPFTEGGGYPVHGTTKSALEACDLLSGPLPATERALVVNDAAVALNDRLRARLAEAGIATERVEQPGLGAMMRQAELMDVPAGCVAHLVHWLDAALPVLAAADGAPTMEVDFDDARVHEQIVELPGLRPMFGVLAHPHGAASDRPMVVLLNAGAAHHVGPNRLHVDLARALGERGISSLRLDLAHLGESASGISSDDHHPYAPTAAADINDALEALVRETPHRAFVLCGLCSGAHNAFQAALIAPAGRIAGLVLLNPLTLYWRAGDSLFEPAASRSESDSAQYNESARSLDAWVRLLADPRRLIRVGTSAARIARVRSTRALRSLGQRLGLGIATQLEHDLRRLLKDGTKITVITAESEPGYRAIRGEAPQLISHTPDPTRVNVSILTDADHTFSSLAARRDLINRIVSLLVEQQS